VPIPGLAVDQRSGAHTEAIPRTVPERLEESRTELRQALQLRGDLADRHEGPYQQPLAANKRRLVDWLVDLQAERVKRLEELSTLPISSRSTNDDDPVVKALDGPPPFSALQVDALRDEIDSLQENLAAAESNLRASQTEIQNRHDQLENKAAAQRLAGEHVFAAKTNSDAAKTKEERDIADLLHRVAESELAISVLDQERVKHQIAILTNHINDLQAVLTRVLHSQRLSPEDLAAQQQRVRVAHDKLGAEIDQIGKRNAKHRMQRERLGATDHIGDRKENFQTSLLDLAVKTDGVLLKGLDYLQMLNSVSGDAWEQRYIALSSADSDQRRAGLEALTGLREKLADLRNMAGIQQKALQTEIREQRIQVDSLAEGNPDRKTQAERVNLLLQQTTMVERVELASTHLERQVGRWLSDFGHPNDATSGVRLAWLVDRGRDLLSKIWQQELFTVEDVSELDGHKISVKYGVTVGKSVGILVVFVAGYWLLVRLSGFVQRQLVRRLNLSEQLASVVQRWSMIVLTLALVVFVLNLARIPLSAFAFLGGALAIGVGFGAQTVIKNFISGLIMLFERKVRVGDIVELGGITGHVTAVDLRATTVLGFNGVEALVPNASFVETQVVNWTHSNRQMRHELRLGVAYGTDVRHAESLMLAAAAEHPGVLDDPAPEAFFENFGESALTVALVYWVELEDLVGPRRIASDLRHDIFGRFNNVGIGIPFPQHDVRVSLAQPVPVCSIQPRDMETIHES
jgi:small-conductance mechanosensitive channel